MIPEHVKRQAMDAVAAYESTPFIRRHADAAVSAKKFPEPVGVPQARHSLSSDEIRKAATDAVAQCKRDVRPVPHDGRVFAMPAPGTHATRSAELITHLNRHGAHVDTVHRMATKEYFGRDHD